MTASVRLTPFRPPKVLSHMAYDREVTSAAANFALGAVSQRWPVEEDDDTHTFVWSDVVQPNCNQLHSICSDIVMPQHVNSTPCAAVRSGGSPTVTAQEPNVFVISSDDDCELLSSAQGMLSEPLAATPNRGSVSCRSQRSVIVITQPSPHKGVVHDEEPKRKEQKLEDYLRRQ